MKPAVFSAGAAFLTSLSQWLIILRLGKETQAPDLGKYALAQALAMPVFLFFTFKLRSIQTTDWRNEYKEATYNRARIVTSLASAVFTIILALICFDSSSDLFLLTVVLSLNYSITNYLEYGASRLQRIGDWKTFFVSSALHSTIPLAALTGVYGSRVGLLEALAVFVLCRICLVFSYDRRYMKMERSDQVDWQQIHLLLRTSLPLAAVAGTGALFTSIPRFFLEQYWGANVLGYYTAVFSLVFFITFFSTVMIQTAAPGLARDYERDPRLLTQHLFKKSFILLILGTAASILSYLAGPAVLLLLFGRETAEHSDVLVWLPLGATVLSLFSLFNVALTIKRIIYRQLINHTACLIIVLVSCQLLVPEFGTAGAALSYLFYNLFGFIYSVLLYVRGQTKL